MINRLIDKVEINYQEYLKINRYLSFKVIASDCVSIDCFKSAKILVNTKHLKREDFLVVSTRTSIVTESVCLSEDFQKQLRCLFLTSLFLKHDLKYGYKMAYDITYNNAKSDDEVLSKYQRLSAHQLLEEFFNFSL